MLEGEESWQDESSEMNEKYAGLIQYPYTLPLAQGLRLHEFRSWSNWPFSNGHAVLGTFKKGNGEVFTVGCTDWAYGLTDKNVSRITKNVLNRFAGLDENA